VKRLLAIAVLFAGVLGVQSAATAAAADGTGTIVTTTTSALYGSTGNTIVFTYTAAAGGMASGEVAITVPSGWSAPTTSTTAAGSSTASSGSVTVSGRTIEVTGVTLAAGGTLATTYGSRTNSGPGATVSSAIGAAVWATREKSTSTGTLTNIASQPSITVSHAADGSGTMNLSPTTSTAGSTGNTIVFTYTAATGGMANGEIAVTVPSGWSAPTTSTTAAGYTRPNTGSVIVSGQTVEVTGVTLAAGRTLTITYGSKRYHGPGATASSTVGAATWTTRQKSTSAGTLADIASQPSLTLTAAVATLATPAAPAVAVASPNSITVSFTPNPNAQSSTIRVYLRNGHSAVKTIAGNMTGLAIVTGLTAGDTYFATITSIGNETTFRSSLEGARSVNVTPGVLTITVRDAFAVMGRPVHMSTTVSGLASTDVAMVSNVTYTFYGKDSTTYGPSTAAPSAVGTYSVMPSGATVVISPSVDQAVYSKTYTYVAGTLTILPRTTVVPHAIRVVGAVWTGRTVVVTIVGTGFYGQPRIISSTGRATTALVIRDNGRLLTVRVTVKLGTPRGVHVFKIILANGLFTNVRYNQR
jgi:hypothetical protein